ncbi:MAG TPA: hypothetical protein EYM91_02365 [Acidobacteria bacterium]|nr:hypothetical protein [Acidobacteriota bacterium]
MSKSAVRSVGGAVIVLALLTVLTLPDSPLIREKNSMSSEETTTSVVSGAFHVHTTRSDGSGTIEEIASAAARAGLSFVITTDHGDGTRTPDPPRYHGEVLLLDGVEVSTTEGHYLAVGHHASAYPLGGEARDVVEDIARLGGFGVAAHPFSTKESLRWKDWTTPIDGIEWLNTDSAWRDESWPRLVLAMLHYPIRPSETIASLFGRPIEGLARWDTLTQRRRVVALAGADAHVRPFPIPSYEQVFRSFSIRVQLETGLSGDPEKDATALLTALREGRVYTAIDALARPGYFRFNIESMTDDVHAGEVLQMAGPATIVIEADLPPNGELRLFQDGSLIAQTTQSSLRFPVEKQTATYRAEVVLSPALNSSAIPWILSNPIYVAGPGEPVIDRPVGETSGTSIALFTDESDVQEWKVEHEETSLAAIDSTPSVNGRELTLRYALSDADSKPFVALVREGLSDLDRINRIQFRVRGNVEQRISLQVRSSDSNQDVRWGRSIYVNTEQREVSVRLQDMRPITQWSNWPVQSDGPVSLMFVVDTLNTAPATSGVIWLDDIRLEEWN